MLSNVRHGTLSSEAYNGVSKYSLYNDIWDLTVRAVDDRIPRTMRFLVREHIKKRL